MTKIIAFPLVVLLIVGGTNVGQADVEYTVTDLGQLLAGFRITNMNDRGDIVGQYCTNYANARAFILSHGTLTDLSELGGFTDNNSIAWGVNNNGDVVGSNGHGFLYSNGDITDLGPSSTNAINDSGQIVGCWVGNNWHPYIRSGESMRDLGVLPGCNSGSANDVNASGWVAGTCDNYRAFLYDGNMHDLGTLPGYTTSSGIAINAGGQVVGNATPTGDGGPSHAFLYSDGSMTDLGTLGGSQSYALDINDSGQVVGNSETGNYWDFSHPFLYSDGTMKDLNGLISPGSDWLLQSAAAINDAGQIVGTGNGPNGPGHIYLLTPVPEPSSLALVGVGTLALFAFRYRKRDKRHKQS
jgi:probable HAF family extracellular repeat protein